MPLDIRKNHPSLEAMIDPAQELQVEAQGFTFIEGGIWNKKEKKLIFNDIPESKTYVYFPGQVPEIIRENTHKANGNAYDLKGNIIVCEHVRSCISMLNTQTNKIEILVSHYKGKELNSPNDVIVKSDGCIFFTDPRFGRNPSWVGLEREQDLDFQGVFKYDPERKNLELLCGDFTDPNGLCFSPDEQYLYVNDPPNSHIRKFTVKTDGSLGDGAVWAVTKGDGKGKPDGMKVDSKGNIYCCAQGGIHIFNPEGICLGVVKIDEQVGNCTFGGTDMKTLYIMATDKLYSLRTKIEGI
ncbi:MAG: SMP-30/gluconolactonase/LRE family protein [Eubacterium sp.]|nr:SMP-30/gluconolactonase/LRE family protein [Eubacterium sp.]